MTGCYGQDWSSYQSSAPDTTGLSFAFVKVTEGLHYVNPKWSAQREQAQSKGLLWGAYHYPNMHDSAKEEADFFLSKVKWEPGDMVVLDWEGYDRNNAGLTNKQRNSYKESYLSYIKSKLPHNPVGIYCNTDYWLNVDTSNSYQDFLWIATAGKHAGDPGIKADWLFHQYSASSVDKDY